MFYLYSSSLAEISGQPVSDELADYFAQNQVLLTDIIQNITPENFFQSVAQLNQLDVKLRLTAFYANNPDFHAPYKRSTIVTIVEAENQQFFHEEVSCPDIPLIKKHSLCYQLPQANKEKSLNLWQLNFFELIEQQIQKGQSFSKYGQMILRDYIQTLQKEGKQLHRQINHQTFSKIYPKLFEIDVKLQIVIETIQTLQQYIDSWEHFVQDVEAYGLADYNTRFMYKLYLDNQTIRFPFAEKISEHTP